MEQLYNENKYTELVAFVMEEKMFNDRHIANLFFRSANKAGLNVYEYSIKFESDEITDALWNKVQFEQDEKQCEADCKKLLKMIFKEGREDILEDFIIFYLDKFNVYPQYDEMFSMILDSVNRDIIKAYLDYLEDKIEPMLGIIRDFKNNEKMKKHILKLKDDYPHVEFSYDYFLKNEMSKTNYEKFKDSLKYVKGNYIIYGNDILLIESFDELKNIFVLKDKFKKQKNVEFGRIIADSLLIEENDFRVYKFFCPEEALNMDACGIVRLILKSRGGSIDKETLKNELMYIHGRETNKWLSKNKKTLSSCQGITVIHDKTERYMLEEEKGSLDDHIGTIKDIIKIRDLILKAKQRDESIEFENSTVKKISDLNDSEIKNEILYMMTGQEEHIPDKIDENNLKEFSYQPFILKTMEKALKNDSVNDFSILNYLNEGSIEKIYVNLNDNQKAKISLEIEKCIRLSLPLNILKWKIAYHLKDDLTSFPVYFEVLRIIAIADSIEKKQKNSDFISCVRKYLFENEAFVDILKKLKEDRAKEIFNEFMKIEFLNMRQKDYLRTKIYELYPSFRKKIENEYEYSTKEGMDKAREELEYIASTKLPELSIAIGKAAELGDLSENSEYKSAREQFAFFSSRAQDISKELSKTALIDFSDIDESKAGIGTCVEIEDVEDRSRRTYTILGPFDADAEKNIISYKSPLALKLIGRKTGEEIEGLKIISIEKFKKEK